jgi:hypothetical protein
MEPPTGTRRESASSEWTFQFPRSRLLARHNFRFARHLGTIAKVSEMAHLRVADYKGVRSWSGENGIRRDHPAFLATAVFASTSKNRTKRTINFHTCASLPVRGNWTGMCEQCPNSALLGS